MSSSIGAIKGTLFNRPELPPLCPTQPYKTFLTSDINGLPATSKAVKSALHLLNDDINEAHLIAQSDEGDLTSCYVHAQLHRRERDYWNSKWWLRTGMHSMHPVTGQVHGSIKKATAFVDACERVQDDDEDLKQKQWEEMKATLEYALQETSRLG